MKKNIFAISTLLLCNVIFAQSQDWFYATMDSQRAQNLAQTHGDKIQIIETNDSKAAVYIHPEASASLKSFNLHGPGFIYRKDKESAIASLQTISTKKFDILDFNISEDEFVNQCLDLVNATNIGETIVMLENYGTRYHTTSAGVQASVDLKDYWQDIVENSGRTDIIVEHYNHFITQQKSVILTIPGQVSPEEIVIIGGHLDCGDWMNPTNAPGADDNASGIGVLTEALKVLLQKDFKPEKTVQIIAYAAEEAGLLGSAEIAQYYDSQNKNVVAVVQFDMTNYNGSENDIYLISDQQYTSSELNLFLIELMQHYNSSGAHILTYGTTTCGYGCSDHASWYERGYLASFPFESKFGEFNPHYHSPGDTYANMGNDASHSAKFTKLALEFVIEVAKVHKGMGTQEANPTQSLQVTTQNQDLIYTISNLNGNVAQLKIYDTSARELIHLTHQNSKGKISIPQLKTGYYVLIATDYAGKTYSKKFFKP